MARTVNVIFTDGAVKAVPPSLIKDLITVGEIVAFERLEGWAFIGQSRIRKKLRPIEGTGQRAYDVYLRN